MQENQDYGLGNLSGTNLKPAKGRFGFRMPSKKILIPVLILVVLLIAGGLVLREYLKPVYVIGDVSITKSDIDQYAKAIDEYKATNKNLDFGGESKQVAVDDLVLNAAFRNEMQKRDSNYFVGARERLEKKYAKEEYSEALKKVMIIRQENDDYKRKYAKDLISIKDFTVVSVPLDSPLFLEKSKEEVTVLRQEAVDRLKNDFLADMKAGKTKEELAKKADVVVFDKDNTDNLDWEQYEKKNVVTIDYRTGYVPGASIFNDKDITNYYNVEVPGIVKTDDKISELGKVGDTTDVFASKAGMYMILRLDNASGGKYNSWNDMVTDYKQKYVNSKFAYLPTATSSIKAIQPKFVESITTIGLQKAQAAIPGGCNAHIVNFIITARDVDTLASIAGMQGRFVRNSGHSCGSQWTGTKNFNTPAGGSVTITDNCWGNQPNWYLDAHPAGYNMVNLETTEGLLPILTLVGLDGPPDILTV